MKTVTILNGNSTVKDCLPREYRTLINFYNGCSMCFTTNKVI